MWNDLLPWDDTAVWEDNPVPTGGTGGTGGTVTSDQINIFPRYNPDGTLNIEGRLPPAPTPAPGPAPGPSPSPGPSPGPAPVSTYTLSMLMNPQQVQVSQATTVTLKAQYNGLPLTDQTISVTSTNQAIGLVPSSIVTNSAGEALFSIIGLNVGTATISASMLVPGATVSANSVVLTVTDFEAPENYAATGLGRVTFSVESAMVTALYPKLQRLSDSDQQRRSPGDDGLKWAYYFAGATITFIPKELLQK